MAVTIPSTAIRQHTEKVATDASDVNHYTYEWKGPYSDLKTCYDAVASGDAYDSKTVAGKNLERIAADYGLLSLELIDPTASASSILTPLEEKWSIKSCRNDVSVMAYCGSTANNPNRAWIELWMKETDDAVARAGNYTKSDGSVAQLLQTDHSAATSELMAKIEKGVESVMRFYPMATRRRTYSTMPDGCLDDLGFIDTPTPGSGAKVPTNLSTKISAYQWLKVQDDIEQIGRNEWARIESWMGILKTSDVPSPWDADLYGDDRWDMPYKHSASAGS